jgi:hypothetical protein
MRTILVHRRTTIMDIPGSPATNFAIVFLILGLFLAIGRRLRRQ